MESDGRELRLRSNFGFMMGWTALTIAVMGYLTGLLLDAMFAAAGLLLGFAADHSGRAAVQITGHILVGIAVLVGLIQSYLDQEQRPDAYPGDE
jgi:hypothetical protein